MMTASKLYRLVFRRFGHNAVCRDVNPCLVKVLSRVDSPDDKAFMQALTRRRQRSLVVFRVVLLGLMVLVLIPFSLSEDVRVSDAVSAEVPASDVPGFPGIYDEAARPLLGAPPFSEFSGHITLIILFQPNCPWCVRQVKAAEELQPLAPFLKMALVSLTGREEPLVREVLKANTEIPAYQGSPELLKALRYTPGTPCVYLLTPDGRLVAYRRGKQSTESLYNMLLGR